MESREIRRKYDSFAQMDGGVRTGRILLLEHGRSSSGRLGKFQDRRAERHARSPGCHWNREPLELVLASGLRVLLRVLYSQRSLRGILHSIEARPA